MTEGTMSASLPWQQVWITGAGRGIGYALTVALVQRGVSVFASARSEAELDALQQACAAYSGKVIPTPLDITSTEQISDLFERWDEQKTCPELVVLNAGTHDPFPAQQFSAERVKRLFKVNLNGTANCIEPVLQRYLAANQGQLVLMASVAGYRGLPTAAAYGASKAALINMAEALYLDLIDTPIKVQVVNPGFVRTPLTDKNDFAMPALMEPEDAAERIVAGLISTKFEITFPKRFVYILKLLRILPLRWYLKLVGKTVKPANT